jgi:hypothetical protein
MTLNLEHPLGISNVNTRMRRYQMPSTGRLKSLKFLLYSYTPMRNSQSNLVVLGFRGRISLNISHIGSKPSNRAISMFFALEIPLRLRV